MKNHDRSDLRHVRLYVDDELPAPERAAFESRLAGDETLRQHVEFERELRRHVEHLMQAHAPTSLADRVRSSLADGDDAAPAPVATIGPVSRSGRGRWSRWLADPRQANVLAVAASLALVAGAVLWGIFGKPLDQMTAPPADTAVDAATFVAGEHVRCAMSESLLMTKASMHDPRDVRMDFSGYLGVEPVLPDLSVAGYEFIGGGHCAVPGHPASVHLIYSRRSADGRYGPKVSIFAVPNVGQFDGLTSGGLIPDRWYEVTTQPQVDRRVDCTTDGRLVYFLVCCDSGDVPSVARLIGEAMRSSR
ncbi:MAG: anti-sigma factor family protein [Planctomycetota bacterium]|jgi:anti-sigma factor RsiW